MGPSGPACCFCRQFCPSSICPNLPTSHNCSLSAYDKLRSLVENTKSHSLLHAVECRRGWEHWPWPATLERQGVSLNENSQKTQTSNQIFGLVHCGWGRLHHRVTHIGWVLGQWGSWGQAGILQPRSSGAAWHPGHAAWACQCSQQPRLHAAHKTRCFSFFSLPFSPLITEPNHSSELWGIFTAELHGGGTWFSLCSLGYRF